MSDQPVAPPDPAQGPPDHHPDPDPGPPDPPWRLSGAKIAVAVILLVTITVPLIVPTYARIEPRLLGFPFFYWYQLLWVFLCAAACGIAFLLIKDKHRSDR